ncbi:winged helix-turn-helix domain-containing protein [Halovenus amylolytica]|uniref:winged helix-turn-helix domain-containing protein n=1 Tax=Halovenus amylolytica TaxID=2500550 RepID=UPI003D6C2A0D
MEKVPPGEHLSPFEAQRKIHELLAQETRFRIIQTILGHPDHLPSLAELAYYSQKSESAVLDQLGELEEHSLVTTYELSESQGKRDLPGTFYGLTDRGVGILDKYNYLRGLPMLQAVHENTVKTERIRRHEAAPRPTLPDAVADALGVTEGTSPGTDYETGLPAVFEKAIRELANQSETG